MSFRSRVQPGALWIGGAVSLTFAVSCADEGSISAGLGGASLGQTGTPGTGGTASGSEDSAGDHSGGDASGGEDGAGSGSTPGSGCGAVRRELLGQVDAVATGAVSVIEESGGITTLFIDASAGGFSAAAANPYVYLSLERGAKVEITDLEADESVEWDLAIKRQVIRTNSGDSGPGSGGAVHLTGEFGSLTANSLSPDLVAEDDFIDEADCSVTAGAVGELVTPFSTWYVYESGTMVLTPETGVFAVRGADGESLYAVEILSYYSRPDGSTGPSSALYSLRYGRL